MPSERAKGKGLTSGTGTSSTGFSGTASAGGGVKDVVSPGELCGFVSILLALVFAFAFDFPRSYHPPVPNGGDRGKKGIRG